MRIRNVAEISINKSTPIEQIRGARTLALLGIRAGESLTVLEPRRMLLEFVVEIWIVHKHLQRLPH